MAEDARYRTRVYLETYINSANLTEDNGSTLADWISCYDEAKYPISRVFLTKQIDLIFTVGTPDTTALPLSIGYDERVPITIWCVDKQGITGTKLRWKAEAELRRICETYPTGSLRTLLRLSDNQKNLGSTVLYSVEYVLNYKRYA